MKSNNYRKMLVFVLDDSWGEGVGRLVLSELSTRTRKGRALRLFRAFWLETLALLVCLLAPVPVWVSVNRFLAPLMFFGCLGVFSQVLQVASHNKAPWARREVDAFYDGALPPIVSCYQNTVPGLPRLPTFTRAGMPFGEAEIQAWMPDAFVCVVRLHGEDLLSPAELAAASAPYSFLNAPDKRTTYVVADVLCPLLADDPGRVPLYRLLLVPPLLKTLVRSLDSPEAQMTFMSMAEDGVCEDGTFGDLRQLVQLTLVP